jgi:integrase/recombinase XerD
MKRTISAATKTATRTTSDFSESDVRMMENATEGLTSGSFNMLHNSVLPLNAITICHYINAMKHELNPSAKYREDVIMLLGRFSIFFKNSKTFKEITRDNVHLFLDSFRRIEASDPLHRWVGTYNIFRVHLIRFFRWLYYPDILPSKNRPKPPPIENIPQLKRKEISIYKPTDLWTEEDDFLFLKYCPSTREKCYHTMSRDASARPHELLKLRMRDLVFKLTPDKKQYAEVLLNGKTGSRSVPLIHSIPYMKDWISQHPLGGNLNSILFTAFGKTIGRGLNERSLGEIYRRYKTKYFPKLLDNPNVPPEDKQKIRDLLKKPWNPYIRRHSALTDKSLKIPGLMNQHAGWVQGSKMSQKYFHYFGDESCKGLLEAYGLFPKGGQVTEVLKPKQCPNCNEPNKPDSRFCAKCRMVLTYDAYINETIEQKDEKDKQLEEVMQKQARFEQLIQTLIDSGQLKVFTK